MAFDWAMLVLRIAVGIIMLAHGVKHARGRQKTATWFASIGFKSPDIQWFMSTATEIGTGILLVLGLITGLAAAGVIGVMAVAFWTVHRPVGFFVTERPTEGWEYVFLIAATSLAIAIGGPGELSIDHGLGLDTTLNGWIGLLLGIGAMLTAGAQIATFWRPASVSASK